MGILFSRRGSDGSGRTGCGGRVVVAMAMVAFSLISYFGYRSINPVTGEAQHVKLSVDQEIAIGLRAAPEMAAQFGGLSDDLQAQSRVEQIGHRIATRSDAAKGGYDIALHLLVDPQTINAFALPGGQVFITTGLYKHLDTDGQIAGVLAHEIGHVIGRHSAEQIAKAELMQGITGAAVIATYDPNDQRTHNTAVFAAMIGQLVNMKFNRNDELEADRLGIQFMAQAGYDPRAMIRVMEVLRESAESGRMPDFFSTHPNPDRRIERLQESISQLFPNGIPAGLAP